MGQFARALEHLRRVFQPYATPGTKLRNVSVYPDALFLTADALGTQKYQDAELIEQQTPGVTSASEFTAVPNDEVWYVLAASCHHDDALNPHNLNLRIRYSTGALNTSVYFAETAVLGTNVKLGLNRSFYLPPRSRLGCESMDNVPAGATLFVRAIRIVLPLGEYTRS